MIKRPIFPNFSLINLTTRDVVLSFTTDFPPYSDYNFTNLWSWNIDAKRKYSILNDNLVIIFTDYRTSAPTISFIGDSLLTETALTIIEFAESLNLEPKLTYIPAEIAQSLNTEILHAEEDDSNADYIFSIAEIASNTHPKLKSKRRLQNQFVKAQTEVVFKIDNLHDKNIQAKILSLVKKWAHNKSLACKEFELLNEERAIQKLLQSSTEHELILSCVYIASDLAAFSIDEILPNHYALSHYIKADITHKGIYEFINQRVATHLLGLGLLHWNWEQDMNIPGLRKLKQSYRPIKLLKKYIIKRKMTKV